MTGKGFGGHAFGSYPIFTVGLGPETLIVDNRESQKFSGKREGAVGATGRAGEIPVSDRVLTVRVHERMRTIKVDSRESLIR